jgi:hypothetical protein
MTVNATLESLVVRCEDTLCDEVDDEIVAMNLDNGAFYGLSPVATDIMKYIELPRRAREIRDHLLSRYQVDTKTCETQVLSLLDQLVAEGLIECRDDDAGSGGDSL